MPSSSCHARLLDLPSFPTRRSSDLGADLGAWLAVGVGLDDEHVIAAGALPQGADGHDDRLARRADGHAHADRRARRWGGSALDAGARSEEHTSELQSPCNLVCRLLPATPASSTYPLSLHDALPISVRIWARGLPSASGSTTNT